MRAILSLLLVVSVAACSGRGCLERMKAPPRPLPPLPPPSPIVDVVVDGVNIAINGKRVSLCGAMEEWEAVLGPARRTTGRPDETVTHLTWDDWGMVIWPAAPAWDPKKRIESFEIYFVSGARRSPDSEVPEHWPRGDFPGRLVVGGVHVRGRAPATELVGLKPRPWFRRGYMHTIFSYDAGNVYTRIDTDHDHRIAEFSMSAHAASTKYLARCDENPPGKPRVRPVIPDGGGLDR